MPGWLIGSFPGLLAVGPGDLVSQFAVESLKLLLGTAQRLRFVAEHLFRGAIDALAQFGDALSRLTFFIASIVQQPAVERSPGRFERLLGVLPAGVTNRLVQFFRQQRLGLLGLFDRFTHPLEQILDVLPLPVDLFGHLFAILRTAQRFGFFRGLVQLGQLLAQLLLLLVQLAGLPAHFAHLLRELARGAFLELVAQLAQFALRPRALGGGPRYLACLERLGRSPDVFANLVELLPLLRHPLLILRPLHPLLQFFGVAENLLLFVAEPLEPPLDVLLFLLRLGFL